MKHISVAVNRVMKQLLTMAAVNPAIDHLTDKPYTRKRSLQVDKLTVWRETTCSSQTL